jgi:two-component system CheB/CheR fusion protein
MTRALTPNEYALLVEHSPVMVWRSGLDASCDYFNQTWLAFTGRTAEQEMGNGWAEGVHPDDFDRCLKHYLQCFDRREAFEMEYRLRRHDGEYRWIFDRGVPFMNERGAFAGFIGSCVDVHDRRRSQEARERRAQERLALSRDFEKRISSPRLSSSSSPTPPASSTRGPRPSCARSATSSTSSEISSMWRRSARAQGFRSCRNPPICGTCAGRSWTTSAP